MSHTFRRVFSVFFVLGALVTGATLSGCSQGSVSQAGPAFINLQMGSLYLSVENRAGRPLLDVRVAIKPVGAASEFTKTIYRLEGSEKRDLSLGEFSENDGTTFNLRVVRPKEVDVTATDQLGTKYHMTTPWK